MRLSKSGSERMLNEQKESYENFKKLQKSSAAQAKIEKETSIKLRRLEAELKLQEGRYRQAEALAQKASQSRDDNSKYRKLIESSRAQMQQEIQRKREAGAISKQLSIQTMDQNRLQMLRSNRMSYRADKMLYEQNELKRKKEASEVLKHKQDLRDQQQKHLSETYKKLQDYYDNKQLRTIKRRESDAQEAEKQTEMNRAKTQRMQKEEYQLMERINQLKGRTQEILSASMGPKKSP